MYVCLVLSFYIGIMASFSLEEDDFNDLFITQSSTNE